MTADNLPRGPLRKTYTLVYWLFVIGVGASVSLSITWHSIKTAYAEGSAEVAPLADCLADETALIDDLRAEASRLLGAPSADIDAHWQRWSATWRPRLRAHRDRCLPAAGDPTRDDRALRMRDLERVHLAYTTAIRGFAEVGRKPLQRLLPTSAP